MSVVVFDGHTLASDSFCMSGEVLYHIVKQGTHPLYFAAYVGYAAVAQYILRTAEKQKPDTFMAAIEIMEACSLKCEEGATLLLLDTTSDKMAILDSKNPVLFLPRQPYYLGATPGMTLFNHCRATYPPGAFAKQCLEMCIKASEQSSNPFATPPIDSLVITPTHKG